MQVAPQPPPLMRAAALIVSFAYACLTANATTLRQMSLAEMARKSSLIVRAKISQSRGVIRGADVYTTYQFQTLQTMKAGRAATQLIVPGGVAGELRQVVTGAPVLRVGTEYVLFLWTGRSGLPQLMGMSQGVFTIDRMTGGDALATRAAAGEQMLDKHGLPVHGEAQSMPLAELEARIVEDLKIRAPRVKGTGK